MNHQRNRFLAIIGSTTVQRPDLLAVAIQGRWICCTCVHFSKRKRLYASEDVYQLRLRITSFGVKSCNTPNNFSTIQSFFLLFFYKFHSLFVCVQLLFISSIQCQFVSHAYALLYPPIFFAGTIIDCNPVLATLNLNDVPQKQTKIT